MTTYDPEKKRAYYLKNRERIRQRQAEYRQGDDWNFYRRAYYAAKLAKGCK